MKKFVLDFQQYANNNNIVSECNSITFVNTGTTDVFINKFLLVAGAALAIGGNENEIDTTVYNIYFPAGAGALSVIKKYYK
jgi:hypothetical protein